MAKVTYSPLVDSIHGKVGNYVLQDVTGVHTGRQLVTPRNPRTTNQQRARTQLARAAQAWRLIPATTREFWVAEGLRTSRSARRAFTSGWCGPVSTDEKISDRQLLGRVGTLPDSFNPSAPTSGQTTWTLTVFQFESPEGWTRTHAYYLATSDIAPWSTVQLSPDEFAGGSVAFNESTNTATVVITKPNQIDSSQVAISICLAYTDTNDEQVFGRQFFQVADW